MTTIIQQKELFIRFWKKNMGSQGFEPWKAEPTDLQSAPFDRSGNSPILASQLRDSNPRPRDYKSRALDQLS